MRFQVSGALVARANRRIFRNLNRCFPYTTQCRGMLTPRRAYSQTSIDPVPESLKKYVRRFPEDSVTCANIDTYLQLRRDETRSNNIIVGIIYENDNVRSTLKIVDALLADPLAGGSETWYKAIQSRAKTENNIFTYKHKNNDLVLSLPEAFHKQLRVFEVGLPVLDAETRPRFQHALSAPESTPNYLELVEINKQQDVHKLVDACSFYVHVTGDLSVSQNYLPRHVRLKVLLTVVDNNEYTPRSVENSPVSFLGDGNVAQHVIKVNSHVLAAGIDAFYKFDTQAASQYFESVQTSNILEASKLLSWFLRTENLRTWTLRLIEQEIRANLLPESRIFEIYEDLKLKDLVKGSQQMHAELQTEFIPETSAYFRKSLPWYMLYLKNDNVEYALKDYFNSHFMNKSIDSYNYLKGQLVARLLEQGIAHLPEKKRLQLDNPLQAYKTELINTRVPPEIQLVVYTLLISAFVYYQLPLSVISLAGYLWVDISSQTALAIAGLGWVLGFNHVSKTWHDFTNSWLKLLFDDVRLVISNKCMDEGLLKELKIRYESAKGLASIKQQVLEDLKRASTGLEPNSLKRKN